MATPVVLRDATVEDARDLGDLWTDSLRSDEDADPVGDVSDLLAQCDESAQMRVVVAEYGGEFAGAVLLQIGTVTPLNRTPLVHVVAPAVVERFRRRGVGRMLIEAGVAFAEENQIAQIGTASVSTSRDANRFMARLGLATRASWRIAPTTTVRARITAMRPSMARQHRQQLGQVLAARRSMRRAATTSRAG